MIRTVTFASCYVYSPCGSGTVCELSRQLRTLVKSGDAHFMGRYAVRVRRLVAEYPPLSGFLCRSQVLVPIPGNSPIVAGSMSVSEQLARALNQAGLGQRVWIGLRRIHSVRRSATAAPGSRPTVDNHYESLEIEPVESFPSQIVLIDDVITKGRTLLAAAARIGDASPATEIRAFALMRTMGFVSRIERLLDPCVGEIRFRAGDAHRMP